MRWNWMELDGGGLLVLICRFMTERLTDLCIKLNFFFLFFIID